MRACALDACLLRPLSGSYGAVDWDGCDSEDETFAAAELDLDVLAMSACSSEGGYGYAPESWQTDPVSGVAECFLRA